MPQKQRLRGRSALYSAAIASFILSVFVSALWLRSIWTTDHVDYRGVINSENHWRTIQLVSYSGRIDFRYSRQDHGSPPDIKVKSDPPEWQSFTGPPPNPISGIFGFHISRQTYIGNRSSSKGPDVDTLYMVQFPDWCAIAGCMIVPALAVAFFRKARRNAVTHLCCKCGYDLRATPLSCPECGLNSRGGLPADA